MLASLTIALGVLRWEAPPGCPSELGVLGQVDQLTGGAHADVLRGLEIDGHIRLHPDGFELSLSVESPSGTTRKTLQAADCSVLGTAAAVVIAVAAAPASVAQSIVPPAEPRGESSTRAQRPEGTELATSPESPRPSASREPSPLSASPRPQGTVRVGASLGRGVLPGFDAGIGVGAGLVGRWFRVDAFASHELARRADYVSLGAGARISAWRMSLRGGPRVTIGALEIHAVLGPSAAAVVGRGYGVERTTVARDVWVGVGVAPGVRWRFAPSWALGADLEVDAALRRPAFFIVGRDELHRTSPVAVRGLVGLEWRFPRVDTGDDQLPARRRHRSR